MEKQNNTVKTCNEIQNFHFEKHSHIWLIAHILIDVISIGLSMK